MQGSNGASSPHGRFCFVHASDLRLDAMMRGIPDAPEALRAMMRDASLAAWQAVVELALDRRAAFVVIAGGIFDAEVPSLRARVALRDGLERLRAARVPAFIALGSDDGGAASLPAWVTAGATVFAEGVPSVLPVRRGGGDLATVLGASCVRSDPARLAATTVSSPAPLIAVLPAPLPQRTLEASAWARQAAIAYWALGGRPDASVDSGATWVASPGTPQGRGLEPPELGPKGCLVVEVEDGHVAATTSVALDRVRGLSLEVEANPGEDAAAVRQRLVAALEPLCADDVQRAFVIEARVAGVAADERHSALLAELRLACAERVPPVWWTQVRHGLSGSVRAAAGSDPLRQTLIARSEALGAPLPRSAFLARHFAPLMRVWNGEIELGAQRELVRDAALLALATLDREPHP